jgi:hypothetical protein
MVTQRAFVLSVFLGLGLLGLCLSSGWSTRGAAAPPFAAPNLTPYQPSGWTDRIVVSPYSTDINSKPDTRPLLAGTPIFVNWAVLNEGDAPAVAPCLFKLYVDGVEKGSWTLSPPLNVNFYAYIQNFSIGALAAGTHTVRIVADPTNVVPESVETDNEYTKTITVVASGQPDLRFAFPSGWPDRIVLSNQLGTSVDRAPIMSSDFLYLDWAVINAGVRATEVGFSTKLYVDGVEKNNWVTGPPLNPNAVVTNLDFPLGKLLPGQHELHLITNATGSINEGGDGTLNEYYRILPLLSRLVFR